MINLPNQGSVVGRNPTTEIRFYSGVPWDNRYTHVRLYDSYNQLLQSLSKWDVTSRLSLNKEYAPVRVGELEVKIPLNEIQALDINYMAFKNPNATEFTFCFVTAVEWLSYNSTRIRLELDIFQNNFYKCKMKPCFVEREHVPKSEDSYGANVIPESIDCGELRCNKTEKTDFGLSTIVLLTTEGLDSKDVQGFMDGGVYQGASQTIINQDEGYEAMAGLASTLINQYNQKGKIDAIINVYMSCAICNDHQDHDITVDTNGAFEGYVPHNNKLYTYPFCYVLADNNLGKTGIFKFELSNKKDNNIYFSVRGSQTPTPLVMLRPKDYNGLDGVSYLESLSYDGFPQCMWKSDVASAWIAQNKNTLALATFNAKMSPVASGISGLASGGILGGLGGVVSGAVKGFSDITNLYAQQKDREIEPPQVHGNVTNTNANFAFDRQGFNLYLMSSSAEVARSIDSYFDMYGYATKRVKQPNLRGRTSWNFVKTLDCGISGNADLAQLAQLRTIFDNGVTLWHTDDVGNYGLDNS